MMGQYIYWYDEALNDITDFDKFKTIIFLFFFEFPFTLTS